MSKDGEEGGRGRRHPLRHCCGVLSAVILTLIVVVLFIILVVYLVLRPSKPDFYLQNITVRDLVAIVDATSRPAPNITIVNIGIQVTLASKNPNDRIGVYYDGVDVYTTYRDQPITVPTGLPPIYLGHKDLVVWSPVLTAMMVPVAPFIADQLRQDIAAGYVLLHVKVDGRVRWKVGTWTSGEYHIFANCPALLTSAGGGGRLEFAGVTQCNVVV